MNNKFLKVILSTSQASEVMSQLKEETREKFIWLLNEAHSWGYFQDFPGETEIAC